MGHYDDDYAYDADRRKEDRIATANRLLSLVTKLRMDSQGNVPDRFVHNLQDYENWLTVNEDLIGG